MIMIDVRSDINNLLRDLREFEDGARRKATVSALNRTGEAMVTEAARSVRKIYSTLRVTMIKKGYFRLEKARRSSELTVKIHPRGGRIPLTFFPARQNRKIGGGVTVRLGNETVTIPHAFIRRRGARRDAVFLRAADFNGTLYNKGNFRQKREFKSGNDLPIAELFARSIPEVILRNRIDATLVRFGMERFSREYEHQIKYWQDRFERRV